MNLDWALLTFSNCPPDALRLSPSVTWLPYLYYAYPPLFLSRVTDSQCCSMPLLSGHESEPEPYLYLPVCTFYCTFPVNLWILKYFCVDLLPLPFIFCIIIVARNLWTVPVCQAVCVRVLFPFFSLFYAHLLSRNMIFHIIFHDNLPNSCCHFNNTKP